MRPKRSTETRRYHGGTVFYHRAAKAGTRIEANRQTSSGFPKHTDHDKDSYPAWCRGLPETAPSTGINRVSGEPPFWHGGTSAAEILVPHHRTGYTRNQAQFLVPVSEVAA